MIRPVFPEAPSTTMGCSGLVWIAVVDTSALLSLLNSRVVVAHLVTQLGSWRGDGKAPTNATSASAKTDAVIDIRAIIVVQSLGDATQREALSMQNATGEFQNGKRDANSSVNSGTKRTM